MISSSTGFCAKDSGGGKLHKIESLYYMNFSLGIQLFIAASITCFQISLHKIIEYAVENPLFHKLAESLLS